VFVSFNQFYVVIACFAFGAVSGVFFSLALPVRKFIKNKYVNAMLDFGIFVAISVLYIIYQYALSFPSFRAYMLFGVFLGLVCYLKSFHIILAKALKKLYNRCIKKKKVKINDRRKKEKANSLVNRRGSAFNGDTSVRANIPVSIDRE